MDLVEPSAHLLEQRDADSVLKANWESIAPTHESFDPSSAPPLPSEVDSFLMWQASSATTGIRSSIPSFMVLDFGIAEELAGRIPASSYPTYLCDTGKFEPIPFCPMPDDELATLAEPVLSTFKQVMVDGLIDKSMSFAHVEKSMEEQREVLETHVRENKPAPVYKKPVVANKSMYQYFVFGWVSDRRADVTKEERVPLVCIIGVFLTKKDAVDFVEQNHGRFSFPLTVGERYKWYSGDQVLTLKQVQNYVQQTDAQEEEDPMEE